MAIAKLEGEELLVLPIELIREYSDALFSELCFGEFDGNLESLTGVTKIRLIGDL